MRLPVANEMNSSMNADRSVHHRSSSCRIGWNTKQSRSRALFFGCSGVGADGRLDSPWGTGEETASFEEGVSGAFIASSIDIDRKVFTSANIGDGINMEDGIL
jgi:hypothetical protein